MNKEKERQRRYRETEKIQRVSIPLLLLYSVEQTYSEENVKLYL